MILGGDSTGSLYMMMDAPIVLPFQPFVRHTKQLKSQRVSASTTKPSQNSFKKGEEAFSPVVTSTDADSGVEDVLSPGAENRAEPRADAISLGSKEQVSEPDTSEQEPKNTDPEIKITEPEEEPDVVDQEPQIAEPKHPKFIPENPFDSEKSRLLFDAVDALQKWGSGKYLAMPQLVIVGEQSAGKSSLLQSLTGIPFPVGDGCCTRFPLRIVSRHTPDEPDSYRISIDAAEVFVDNIPPSHAKVQQYERRGEILTTADFLEVVDEVTKSQMEIRSGTDPDSKNFAAEVLRVEISGPNRSHFSIVDLPGIFDNAFYVNNADIDNIQQMAIEYIKRPENIVICVVDPSNDLSRQKIFNPLKKYVEPERLVGVFTKCDLIKDNDSRLCETVSIVEGNLNNPEVISPSAWFVVRNRRFNETASFDLHGAEADLFGVAPWTDITPNRLGSIALKDHLGSLLREKISSEFPAIQERIEDLIKERLLERDRIGDPRESHIAMRQYLITVARGFDDLAGQALGRPGFFNDQVMELRNNISHLNQEFSEFMRQKGAKWAFQDYEVEPRVAIMQNLGLKVTDERPKQASDIDMEELDKTFTECAEVGSSDALVREIELNLQRLEGVLLPGLINPDIYPRMYTLQVGKWTQISDIHLGRVCAAVKNCYEAILNSVCPPTGGTAGLHEKLTKIVGDQFEASLQKARDICDELCSAETQRKFLSTTDPKFQEEVHLWRQLRFLRGFNIAVEKYNGVVGLEVPAPEKFDYYFQQCHPTANMVLDIQDVLRVYYKISREAFIQNMVNRVTEDFVSDRSGPLRLLNTDYVDKLTEDEIEFLGGEDEATTKRRWELQQEIEQLQHAQKIAQDARADLDTI